jgi:hypothetical protein
VTAAGRGQQNRSALRRRMMLAGLMTYRFLMVAGIAVGLWRGNSPRKDQRIAPRVVVENRFGRRVRENAAVPVEVAVDARRGERRRQRALRMRLATGYSIRLYDQP